MILLHIYAQKPSHFLFWKKGAIPYYALTTIPKLLFSHSSSQALRKSRTGPNQLRNTDFAGINIETLYKG